MPIDWLTLLAAALSGLLGSVHCAAMCGGIATGFSAAGTSQGWISALQPNLGRILGYSVAGALAGGLGHGIVAVFQFEWLALLLRAGVGVVLVIVALRLWGGDGWLRFLPRPGVGMWQRLKPIQRRLLPADSASKRIALGVLWGWLPCGLSGSLLTAAWLQADVRNAALTMAVFGLGTLPMMWPLTWSGARLGQRLQRSNWRRAAGAIVLLAGLITIASPWLLQLPLAHAWLSTLGCLPRTG